MTHRDQNRVTLPQIGRICMVCRKRLTTGTMLKPVCNDLKCQQEHRFNEAQRVPRCPVCGVFLSVSEKTFGSCESRSCRSQKAADDQQIRWDVQRKLLLEKAKRVTVEDAKIRGFDLGKSHEPAIVPYIGRGLSSLAEHRKDDYLNRLREKIEENFEIFPEPPEQLPEEDFGECFTPQVDELIGRACSTCEGCCCRVGFRNASYIKEETLLRYRHRHPDAGPEDILQDYSEHIGDQTYEDSCVYHGATGCTLPKELRSAMCDEYICYGVKDMLVQFETRPETMGYVVATECDDVCGITPLIEFDVERPATRVLPDS